MRTFLKNLATACIRFVCARAAYIYAAIKLVRVQRRFSLKDVASGQSCGRVPISLVGDVSRSRDYYIFNKITSDYNA